MTLGTLMIGAYMAMNDPSGYLVGSLFAFMMLSQRVAQPLVGMARLVEDFEEVTPAIGEAASVLKSPARGRLGAVGLRPKLIGAISSRTSPSLTAAARCPRSIGQVSPSRRHHAWSRGAQRIRQVHDYASLAGA